VHRVKRLDPERTLVLVVDVQEKLERAMPPESARAVERAGTILIEGAALLGARVVATEQYPQGLGPTTPALAERLARGDARILSKIEFSACDAPGFAEVLTEASADGAPESVVVIGMEAHVCVYQTVRDLTARGFDVHVPIDGVASRRDDHRETGLALCRAAGATITTTETIAFDWLRRASGDAFKSLSKLIR
jgi:nicotinamidase-related amidase